MTSLECCKTTQKAVREFQLITTEDGSHSLWLPALEETYHSTHGAIQESQHVFIQQGLMHCLKEQAASSIMLLEVGLGTGLNVLLTYLAWLKIPFKLTYTGLEPYPVPWRYIEAFNYAAQLTQIKHYAGTQPALQDTFERIHQGEPTSSCYLSDRFLLHKYQQPLEAFAAAPNTFDIVYFDAFAPSKQPDMWEFNLLQKVCTMMKGGGVMVTYCAQGKFKRLLKELGMYVETIPGPPGKREMTRAQKRGSV